MAASHCLRLHKKARGSSVGVNDAAFSVHQNNTDDEQIECCRQYVVP
jgi:hypothetical protein